MQIAPLPGYLQTQQTTLIGEIADKVLKSVHADRVIEEALTDIKPQSLTLCDIHNVEHFCPWSNTSRIHILGAGKASAYMARALLHYLPSSRVAGGIVITKKDHGIDCPPVECLEGDHPVPSQNNVQLTQRLLAYIQHIDRLDTVFFCLSGGASALLCQPLPSISIQYMQSLTQKLLESGASIHEINCIRTALSQIKGGGLAQKLLHAQLITLALSDVNGDSPEVIGSAPTYFKRADLLTSVSQIAEKYTLSLPQEALSKQKNACYNYNNKYIILANNKKIIDNIQGYVPLKFKYKALTSDYLGDIMSYARLWINEIQDAVRDSLIAGGSECTVKLVGKHGLGGRNMHLALMIAKALYESGDKITFVSIGSDGTDGATTMAGAVVNHETWAQDPIFAEQCLETMDSHSYFKIHGGLIYTGDTATNVNDFQLLIS